MAVSEPAVTIANGNWGATSLRAVGAVLESAATVLCDAFDRCPDAPVRVLPGDGPPYVAWDRRPYLIWISARDTYWCQYAYEFSHELCHVLVNFDGIRHHRHKWFEESLCELAAFFVLIRLSERFRHCPPPEVFGAEEFAPHFATYAHSIAGSVPAVPRANLPAWLSRHIPALETHHAHRSLNRTAAVAMLDSFLEDESLWRDCAALNRWDASADSSFADHLDSWTAHLLTMKRAARTPRLLRDLFHARSAP